MNSQSHWERIYAEKAPDAVSWYRPHLEKSLSLIERFAPRTSAAIIDVGGGESTLVDDLLARGYENVTVLDIPQAAIDASRKRLSRQKLHESSNCNAPSLLKMVGQTLRFSSIS